MFRSNQPPREQSKNQQTPTSKKLPQLWSTPTIDNVVSMLTMSKKDPGLIVEQFWTVEGQDCVFDLKSTADENGDPIWAMSKSTLKETKTLWEHRTVDTGLIHSLIIAEVSGDITASSSSGGLNSTSSISLGVVSAEVEPVKAAEEKKKQEQLRKEEREDVEAVLQGDINKVQLPTVLQSIQIGQMTGRLAIRSEGRGVDIYFDDGEPIHASDGVDTGQDVIMDLISLKVGKFRFLPDERTMERSINRRLDGLIMEAITLVDQSSFLEQQQGLNGEAYLIARNPSMSPEEFEEAVYQGNPVDPSLQRQLYREIGDYKKLSDVLRSKPLKRSEWVPIVFNLVTLNLIGVSDKPPQTRKATQLLDAQIDIKTLEQVLKPCMRAETGILTYPAFQYFVSQECFRYELCGMPLSVMVFSIRRRQDYAAADFSVVKEIMMAMSVIKRPIDMLGHFQMFDYAVVLPNTGTRSAAVFAQKTLETVNGMTQGAVVMNFGIAGIPENCKTMGQLLSASYEAKKHAESAASPVILYQNIQSL